jgi:hypothetical protein
MPTVRLRRNAERQTITLAPGGNPWLDAPSTLLVQ